MLVHTGLMILCGMISYALADDLAERGTGGRLLSEFITAFGYAAPFICAAALLMILIPGEAREPMRLRPAGGIDTVLVVIAGIGITYGAAYLNSLFVSFIDFSGVYEDTAIHDPTDIVSAFLQTALVPRSARSSSSAAASARSSCPTAKRPPSSVRRCSSR